MTAAPLVRCAGQRRSAGIGSPAASCLVGVVAPIVEELCFRGLLTSRIPVGGRWAPALNAGLLAIYHFFSPWSYVAIFAAFLPLVSYFRISGTLVPVVVTHCLFNSVGILAARARLAQPWPRVRS